MTTGIVLGTQFESERVYKAAADCGFAEQNTCILPHKTVPNLRLQVKPWPAYFSGVDGIATEIEFDDLSNKFPENPDAIKVLDMMYSKLPDLIYRKRFLLPELQTPINSLSEFFKSKK